MACRRFVFNLSVYYDVIIWRILRFDEKESAGCFVNCRLSDSLTMCILVTLYASVNNTNAVTLYIHLRTELDFRSVHGITNTSGLLQETRRIHESVNIPKIDFFAYMYILLNMYLKYEIIYNLGNKSVLYLICKCINGFVGV